MVMVHLIYPLRSVCALPLREVGSKAARLSEVAKLGFHVPDGIIVSVEAYKSFCRQEPLFTELEHLLPNLPSEIPLLRDISGVFQSVFLQTNIQEDLISDIQSEVVRIKATETAVRSSAPEEDGASASFAGILHTSLGVPIERLPEAIKSCWASVFSLRSLLYCARKKFNPRSFGLALIIQEMLIPSEAGVCFTANPVTRSTNELVVEAVRGGGEDLVSGRVTPWRAIITKEGAEHSNHAMPTVEHQSQDSCLTAAQLKSITDAALAIEDHFGLPQDIEFAFQGTSLYILQARPVTALRGGSQ